STSSSKCGTGNHPPTWNMTRTGSQHLFTSSAKTPSGPAPATNARHSRSCTPKTSTECETDDHHTHRNSGTQWLCTSRPTVQMWRPAGTTPNDLGGREMAAFVYGVMSVIII